MNDAALALAARIVLALVLASSAVAKLRIRGAVRVQVETLVSRRAAPLVAPLLPAVEILVALGLVAWWSPVPGVVSVILLALFTAVVVRAAARHVPCVCFGAPSLDAPTGATAVVRNGVLAVLAVFAVGDPSGAPFGATLATAVVLGTVAGLAVRAAR